MKEEFRTKKFGAKSIIMLKKIIGVVQEYQQQNIKLTLRQLYYQLVSRDIIANNLREYAKLSSLLTDARYCGLVDWNAIEDRIRTPEIPSEFDDVADLIEAAKRSYRLPRWKGQEYYVELYTEKDALSSVLQPIASKWHIAFSVNRGYSSASAMYDASKRFLDAQDDGKKCVLLYLGDHDPSGLDMVRDVQERLEEFGCEVEVRHIALTTEQVRQYKPPPNPAKITDPRAAGYITEHGRTSWEVDALRPEVMNALVEKAILEYVDSDKMQEIIKKEKKDMDNLAKFAEGYVEDEDDDEDGVTE